MANSLLDFVMSVVRDPGIAAQYAANPAQAIADAHLTDVTAADVNNLIPVVAESFSAAAPSSSKDSIPTLVVSVGSRGADNVWASGAATAAFDAFDAVGDHLPVQGLEDAPVIATDLIAQHDDLTPFEGVASAVVDADLEEPGLQFDGVPAVDAVGEDAWDHAIADDQIPHLEPHPEPHQDPSGLDIFD